MNQGFNKNLIILFITPVLFIITGIALICAGSLDNMVAGISMLILAAWLYLFFIVAFEWLGCTVSLKGNELVYRKGINRVQHITLDKVEEIAFGYDGIRGECLKLILKSGEVIVVPGVKDGWKLVRKVRKSVPVSAPSKTIEILEKECLKAIKKRVVLIGKILFLVLILVISLAVAIIATEGKEIDCFNERDWWFFGVFMSIFVLCLFGVLAFMPSLFRLIRDVQGKIWAWKRGMLFEDTLELPGAQEVYVSIGVDARFSYKKEIVNDVGKVISSMEVYMLKKRKMEKKSVLFYDAEAEAFWKRVIGDDDARPITELIKAPEYLSCKTKQDNMKKDIFNGKIAAESKGIVKFTLIFTPLICILCGIIFLLVALFYDNVEYAARIFLYCLSSMAIVAGISYPLITLHLIKIYPKHRKITKLFIKEYVFREYDFKTEKSIYKD